MANYTPPPKNNIPFHFSTGGYSKPDFGDVRFNFQTRETFSQTAELQAAINVMGIYQEETYTFLRYCERYVVGYTNHGVQILKGRCFYGGIRDIGAYIRPYSTEDLGGYIKIFVTGQKDLPAHIAGKVRAIDLPAFIGGHPPGNLPGYIRGLVFEDLSAQLNQVYKYDLPATAGGHLPGDLPAYLKPWPQRDLPGNLYGWDQKDLGGLLNVTFKRDLSATIGVNRNIPDLRGIIKGWVREAYVDLPAFIRGMLDEDLGGIIKGVERRDLPAYLFAIRPRDLPAYIRGWQEADLPASIIGDRWPWDLPASMIGYPPGDLPAYINPIGWTLPNYKDLPAYILGTRGRADLTAQTYTIYASSLPALLDTGRDIANLSAYLRPKTIRLTGIIDVITMEHLDLSATISIPCFYSDLINLSAYLRPVFISDLIGVIYPKGWIKGVANLGAKWGYAPQYVFQDKLPINLSITAPGYRVEDKLRIYLQIYREAWDLGAYIFGEYISTDLPASVNTIPLSPYEFDNHKFRELFYNRTYSQVVRSFQEIDIEFETIVYDYLYSSAGDFAAKTNRYEHFVTKISSYFSPETSARIDRKLHKVKKLYGLDHFDSIDEAMRYAIHYVTTDFQADLNSIINIIGALHNLSAYLNPVITVSTSTDLTSAITGSLSHPYDVVVAFTEDGVGYLEFS